MSITNVYEVIQNIAAKKGIHLSSFGWANVKAVDKEARSGKLSNLQIIERLKREENLRLDLDNNDWREIGRKLK